jgi:hypothetical protein
VSLELVGESFCKAVIDYFNQRSSGDKATLQDIRLILVDDITAKKTRHSFVQYVERSSWLECSRRLSTSLSAAPSASAGGSKPVGCLQWSEVGAYEKGGASVGNSKPAGGPGGRGMLATAGQLVSSLVPSPISAMLGYPSSENSRLSRGESSRSSPVAGHEQGGSVNWIASGHGYGGSSNPSTSNYGGGQPPYSSTSGHGGQQYLPNSGNEGSAGGNSGKTSGSSPRSTDYSGGAASSDDICVICLKDTIKSPKKLPCGHAFCKKCIDEQFKYQPKCPSCGKLFGTLKGNQPPGGTMKHSVMHHIHLAGYQDCGTIEITYSFPGGNQRVRANVYWKLSVSRRRL